MSCGGKPLSKVWDGQKWSKRLSRALVPKNEGGRLQIKGEGTKEEDSMIYIFLHNILISSALNGETLIKTTSMSIRSFFLNFY